MVQISQHDYGEGVRAVREHGGRGARVGLTDNCETVIPVTESPEETRGRHAERQLSAHRQSLAPSRAARAVLVAAPRR